MPSLNFSAVEILPELLKFFDTEGKEGKNQTIRPLKFVMGSSEGKERFQDPRLKVGDEATIYWKQRTSPKDSWFCRRCGALKYSGKLMYGMVVIEKTKPECDCGVRYDFPKKLGKVKITEVFEIEMHKKEAEKGFLLILKGITRNLTFSERELDIPHRDGFSDFRKMFKWFDKQYDLSQPKRFAVYRWEWNK